MCVSLTHPFPRLLDEALGAADIHGKSPERLRGGRIVSFAARGRLGHRWSRRHRRLARGSVLFTVSACDSYGLQIGVNFSGIAAAPLLSPSCCPHREGLELALFPYHQLVLSRLNSCSLLPSTNTDRVLCRSIYGCFSFPSFGVWSEDTSELCEAPFLW